MTLEPYLFVDWRGITMARAVQSQIIVEETASSICFAAINLAAKTIQVTETTTF